MIGFSLLSYIFIDTDCHTALVWQSECIVLFHLFHAVAEDADALHAALHQITGL